MDYTAEAIIKPFIIAITKFGDMGAPVLQPKEYESSALNLYSRLINHQPFVQGDISLEQKYRLVGAFSNAWFRTVFPVQEERECAIFWMSLMIREGGVSQKDYDELRIVALEKLKIFNSGTLEIDRQKTEERIESVMRSANTVIEKLAAAARGWVEHPAFSPQSSTAIAPSPQAPAPITPQARSAIVRSPKGELQHIEKPESKGDRLIELLNQIFKTDTFELVHEIDGVRVREFGFRQRLKNSDGSKTELISAARILNVRESLKVYGLVSSPVIFAQEGAFVLQVAKKNWQPILIEEWVKNHPQDIRHDALTVELGLDVRGNPVGFSLSDRGSAHLLLAGRTGKGKTGVLDTLLYQLMWQQSPASVQFLLIDVQKGLGFAKFAKLPWVVEGRSFFEVEEIMFALQSVIQIADKRATLLSENRCEDIEEYNRRSENPQPRLVIVIDEQDGVRTLCYQTGCGKDFDRLLDRITQEMAKLGIHLICCTQRPSADSDGALTASMRANMGVAIALSTKDAANSELILGTDNKMAKSLQGKGDAYILISEQSDEPIRTQVYWTKQEYLWKFHDKWSNTYFSHTERKFKRIGTRQPEGTFPLRLKPLAQVEPPVPSSSKVVLDDFPPSNPDKPDKFDYTVLLEAYESIKLDGRQNISTQDLIAFIWGQHRADDPAIRSLVRDVISHDDDALNGFFSKNLIDLRERAAQFG